MNTKIVNWLELIEIINSLQISSGHAFGKKHLTSLLILSQNEGFYLEKNNTKYFINSFKEFQKIINEYDPSINLRDFL